MRSTNGAVLRLRGDRGRARSATSRSPRRSRAASATRRCPIGSSAGPNGRGFITGNPDLEPETSLQWDFGVALHERAACSAAAYVYHYRINNLIERVLAGDGFLRVPQSRARRDRGLRGRAAGRPRTRVLHAVAAPDRPRHAARRRQPISTTFPPTSCPYQLRKAFDQRFSTFFRFAVYAEDDRPGPSEIVAPGHTNLDLGATLGAPQEPRSSRHHSQHAERRVLRQPRSAVCARARRQRVRDGPRDSS